MVAGAGIGRIALVHTECVVCGRGGSRPLLSFSPPGHNHGVEYMVEHCPHCQTAFINPHPTPGEIRRFFSNEAIFKGTADPEGRARQPVKERGRRVREFSGYVRRIRRMVSSGRALDAGCGLGLFLELLGPKFDRVGLDINPFAAKYVRERVGIETVEADALEAEFAPGTFDLVSAMQTLDHLARPGLFLEKASRWLRPGGVLFLSALININSLMARIFKEDFRLLHPFHGAYFSPGGLRRLLARFGFRTVRLEYPYFKTPFFNRTEVGGLMKKCFLKLTKTGGRVLSPPFIGNTINAYALKGA